MLIEPPFLDALLVAAFVQLVMNPVGAWFAERLADEKLFLQIALAWAMLAPYPLFLLVELRSGAAIALGLALNVLGSATFYAVIPATSRAPSRRGCATPRSRSPTSSAARSRAG